MDQNACLQEQNIGIKCIGSDASYMKLISADGFCCYIEKPLALSAKPIKDMYLAKKESNELFENVLCLNEIQGRTMNIVCKYLQYKTHYEDYMNNYVMTKKIPLFPIVPEESLDCLLAACYLHI